MKYDSRIGYLVGIITLSICIFLPFADIIGIQIPKTITIASAIFVAVVIIGLFSAGLAEDLKISFPKGVVAFIYYIFGFIGGSIIIATYLGFYAVVIFLLLNGAVFYAISSRNE
ncbi:MAG TPA: hypothetical protein ENH23_02770 [candidate division Zixibacteria bacterium]|nr:hypothetical protein [candidate division Zixibacteria bacterium]